MKNTPPGFTNKEGLILVPDHSRAGDESKSMATYQLFPWMKDRPQWTGWNAELAIREGFQSSSWVYACVQRRADAIASVPIVVETKAKGGKDWKQVDNHPLKYLLDNPNPEMSTDMFLRYVVTHLDLAGNSFDLKVRGGDGAYPVELWPVMPDDMLPVAGRDRLVSKYKFVRTSGIEFQAQDVLHMMYVNPSNFYYGQSPLMAAGRAVDVDNAGSAWQKIAMQNRAVPDGVFSFDAQLSPQQFEEVKQQVREQYAGIGRSRAPWVLSKSTYTQLSLTPVEMDYINTRLTTMREICAAYGVPSEMISGMGDANRASGDNVRKVFWLDTIVPLIRQIEAFLNMNLARDFGSSQEIRIRFDLKKVPALQESYDAKVSNAKNIWSMGVPFNEINKRLELGFEEVDGGDVGYLPAGLIPTNFGEDPNADPLTGLPPADAAKLGYGKDVPPGTDPAAPPVDGTAPTDNVQAAVLNGTQMASLQAIVQAVVDKTIPAESAIVLIMISVPGITREQVEAMINPAINFEAPKEPAPIVTVPAGPGLPKPAANPDDNADPTSGDPVKPGEGQ